MASEWCEKCHKMIEFAPRKQLVSMQDDVCIIEPYYCPFCKNKGFRLYVYEYCGDQRNYGVNDIFEMAEKTGRPREDFEQLYKEHKANCMKAAEVEPRNLVEMLAERSEQYRIERNHDKL